MMILKENVNNGFLFTSDARITVAAYNVQYNYILLFQTKMSGAVKQAARSLGNNVKEFRLHLCQTSSSSAGVRNFIEQHYVPLKVANPHMPIMVRECSGVVPRVYARYSELVAGFLVLLNTSY